MEIKLDLDLKEISKIAYVSSLYQLPDIESELKKTFLSMPLQKLIVRSDYYRSHLKSSYHDLIDKVRGKVDYLPKTLQHDIGYMIRVIGDKIIEWFEFILNEPTLYNVPLDRKYELYAKDLCWTPYGLIDEVRTVKSWMKNPNVDLVKVFQMACLFCMEDVIFQLWDQVSDAPELKNFQTSWKQDLRHVAYWIAHLRKNLQDFVKYAADNYWNRWCTMFKRECLVTRTWYYSKKHSLEVNMFIYSFRKSQILPAKYFWSKMKIEERFNADIALYSLKCLNDSFKLFHRRTKYMECLAFFLNHWSEIDCYSELLEMLKARSAFLIIVADVWPWQTSPTSIFDFANDITFNEYMNLMEEIVHDRGNNSSIQYPESKNYSSTVRSCAWRGLPESIRNSKLLDITLETFGSFRVLIDLIYKKNQKPDPKHCEAPLIVLSNFRIPYGFF